MLDETVQVKWPEGTEDPHGKIAQPGDNIEMIVETTHPIAMEPGLRFNIREGGRTVATGLVTQLV